MKREMWAFKTEDTLKTDFSSISELDFFSLQYWYRPQKANIGQALMETRILLIEKNGLVNIQRLAVPEW